MDNTPIISIICNTYNQENFIRDALNGFVMQKTNFPFEILIHDDASTDRTADIIREYHEKYPEIIFPIYQIENQWSKDIEITPTFQFPRVRGKYIAFCEGDDFWTDPYKLQKQYDVLEQHPEIDICAHSTLTLNGTTGIQEGGTAPSEIDCIFSPEDVIAGGGAFVSTCSLMFHRELTIDPPLFRKLYNTDYTLQVYGSLRGGMYYLHDTMAAYRWQTPGSWTKDVTNNIEKHIAIHNSGIQLLRQMDEDTEGKYQKVIRKCILKEEFQAAEIQGDYHEMLKMKYRKLLKQYSLRYRMNIFLKSIKHNAEKGS